MATRHVILGYDGSPRAQAASARAIDLAKQAGDCDIVVVCTHERLPEFRRAVFLMGKIDESQWRREWEAKTAEDLHQETLRIRLAGVEATSRCSSEDTERLLADVAAELGADCIVVADDAGGFLRNVVLGSMVKRLKRATAVPVVAVRGSDGA